MAPIVAKETDPEFNPKTHIREKYANETYLSGEAYFWKGKWNRYEDLNYSQQWSVDITAEKIFFRKQDREDRQLLYGESSSLYGQST